MREMCWEHMKSRNITENRTTITVVNLPSYVACICPHCGEDIEIEYLDFTYMMSNDYYEDWAGETFECPECGKEISVKGVNWN